MIKLDLKTIAVIAIRLHLRQRCISLRADRHIPKRLAVNHDRTYRIFLVRARTEKSFPVIHHNVDRMHGGCLKQALFVTSDCGRLLYAKVTAIHKKDGKNERRDNGRAANPIQMLMSRHRPSLPIPYILHYS